MRKRNRVLAGIAAAAIAVGAGLGGHELAQPSAPLKVCQEGPGCVIDQIAPPAAAEDALAPDAALGTIETPQSLIGAGGNGHLSLSALSPVTGGHPTSSYPGTGQLANTPAAAWNALSVKVHNKTGTWLNSNGSDSMYRPYERQVYWRNYWCSRGACQNAAVPGTSNHGLGWAVDTDPTSRALIIRYGGHYGWSFSCSDAPWESWHVKWCGGWSGRDPGPYGKDLFQPIKRGSKGKGVGTLTSHLALLAAPGKRDHFMRWSNRGKVCGKPCVSGIRRFQRAEHLGVDGVAGPKTDARLDARWAFYKKHHRRGH